VTVATQPSSPAQTCTVTNGTGTAAANVGDIQITCSTGTIAIGGTVTGLAKAGSGVVLQDNGGDNLTIHSNGTFTFPTLIASGGAYHATILTQPSGPNQVCTVTNGSGNTSSNITNIQVTSPAIFHTIGGNVVGLVGTTSQMVLQNNLGDNLTVSQNGAFTFNTPIADGSTYDVSLLVGASTQPEVGIVLWAWEGTATAAVTSVIVDAGHNDWAWFDGSNTHDQNGTFGGPPTSGTTFDTDTPGGRRYPATWTDLNGNLWLFGGFGLTYSPGLTSPATELNDMWEPAYTAGPSPRDGVVTWTDPNSGDLFLFGGEGSFSVFSNEVWSYHIANNTWTRVSGSLSAAAVYGTLGTAASANTPGGRWGATARLSGNTLWLFGGFGYDSAGNLGLLNDLWNYNLLTGQWTWVAGSKTVNPTGSYGTLGTSNGLLNFQGGRQLATSWIDGSGNFWIFGGFDLDSVGSPDALNDLWEYKSGVWTWMSGANVVNQKATYGTQGVAAATNVPGARWSAAAWTDHNGDLWLFGGQGYDSTASGSLADLWQYKGGKWIWVKGPSSVGQSGNYGLTPGPIIYPYVGNFPGSRYAAGFWTDTNGNDPQLWKFWIFGGEGFDASSGNGNGLLDDLWRYLPYP
jgi:hypothetical protein